MLIRWFEIPVFDFKRAVDFYSRVFTHVKLDIVDFNGVAHAIFKPRNPDKNFDMTGALVESKKLTSSPGVVLFFSANVGMNEIIERIKINGGTIVLEKTLIRNYQKDGKAIIPQNAIDGNVGYYSYFMDTEGNKLGLYSNN